MVYTISRFKFWRNLQGDFIYRVHPRLRKAINIMISVVLGALVLAGLYLPQAIIKENYDEMEKHDM